MPLYLLFIWQIVTTLLNSGDIRSVLGNIVTFFAASILTMDLIRMNPRHALKDLVTLFTGIMILQYISFITHFMGYSGDQGYVNRFNYFLGIRVNISSFFFFAICLSLLYAQISYISGWVKAGLIIFMGIHFIISEFVSTAIVGVVIYALILLGARSIRSRKILKFLIIMLLCSAILFAFIGRTESFQYFLVDLLGESISISGRTTLWKQAIQGMNGVHLFIGHGMGLSIFQIGRAFQSYSAHNQYLNILYYYGLPGIILYIMLTINQIRAALYNKRKIDFNILACIITVLICQVATTIYEMPFFYIFYIVSCYSNLIPFKDDASEMETDKQRQISTEGKNYV